MVVHEWCNDYLTVSPRHPLKLNSRLRCLVKAGRRKDPVDLDYRLALRVIIFYLV